MKALVALAHKMIRIVYVIITEGVTYQEYKKDQRALRTLVSKN
jgi:hypothetical protein